MKLFAAALIAQALLLLTGCTTGQLRVDSAPGQAEIFVKATGGSDFKSLGPAPLTKKLSEVKAVAGGAGSVELEARKTGYISRSVVITDLDTSSDLKINLDLQSLDQFVKSSSDQGAEAAKQMISELNEKHLTETNQLVDQLFEAQRMAQVGRLDDAYKRLEELRQKYPNVATIYELQGGIAYMQADYNKALDSYTTAARYNPDNLELINMRNYLEKKLNVQPRAPAGRN